MDNPYLTPECVHEAYKNMERSKMEYIKIKTFDEFIKMMDEATSKVELYIFDRGRYKIKEFYKISRYEMPFIIETYKRIINGEYYKKIDSSDKEYKTNDPNHPLFKGLKGPSKEKSNESTQTISELNKTLSELNRAIEMEQGSARTPYLNDKRDMILNLIVELVKNKCIK